MVELPLGWSVINMSEPTRVKPGAARKTLPFLEDFKYQIASKLNYWFTLTLFTNAFVIIESFDIII
jgi:hypothetical protein